MVADSERRRLISTATPCMVNSIFAFPLENSDVLSSTVYRLTPLVLFLLLLMCVRNSELEDKSAHDLSNLLCFCFGICYARHVWEIALFECGLRVLETCGFEPLFSYPFFLLISRHYWSCDRVPFPVSLHCALWPNVGPPSWFSFAEQFQIVVAVPACTANCMPFYFLPLAFYVYVRELAFLAYYQCKLSLQNRVCFLVYYYNFLSTMLCSGISLCSYFLSVKSVMLKHH